MKKIIFTLLAAVMTLSASAQGIEIQKTTGSTTTTVASYTNTSTDTYKAILKKTPASPAPTIKLNRSVLGIRKGATVSLVATASDGATVSWASDNNAVTVNSSTGLVTGVTSGETATITATATLGTQTATATCNVTVDYVDMGSAGKWAVCNVGANYDVEYGGYYCWGKTLDKDPSNSYASSITQGGENDTAYLLWGSSWKMPAKTDFDNLQNTSNATRAWKSNYDGTGIAGVVYTSVANPARSVFFPAAGYSSRGSVNDQGYYGTYWSSTPGGSGSACSLDFNSSGQSVGSYNRRGGYSVRAVHQ